MQFASFLADVDRSPTSSAERREGFLRALDRPPAALRRGASSTRVVITAAFYGAYVLRLGSNGTPSQQRYFIATLPVLLFARYLVVHPDRAVPRRVALRRRARRHPHRGRRARLGGRSPSAFMSATRPRGDFPRAIFVIDALLCTLLIGASRFWERAAYRGVTTLRTLGPATARARRRRRTQRPQLRARAARDAGRAGRRLRRRRPAALAPAPARRAGARQRRRDAREIIAEARPDLVFVAIPDAPSERLDLVLDACVDARRRLQHRPPRDRGRAVLRARALERDVDPQPWRSLSPAARRPSRARRAPARKVGARRRPPARSRSSSGSACSTAGRRGATLAPWLNSDEFERAQLSRAVASTGHEARRDGAARVRLALRLPDRARVVDPRHVAGVRRREGDRRRDDDGRRLPRRTCSRGCSSRGAGRSSRPRARR